MYDNTAGPAGAALVLAATGNATLLYASVVLALMAAGMLIVGVVRRTRLRDQSQD